MIDPRTEATKHVEAFIRAWHEGWSSVHEAFAVDVDFARWQGIVAAIDAIYFAPGSGSGSGGSYGNPPTHDPAREKVTGVNTDRESGRLSVETVVEDVVTRYWEYELAEVGGELRILKAHSFLAPRGTLVVPPDEAARVLAQPAFDAPIGALARGVAIDGGALFAHGRRVTLGNREHALDVRNLGELCVRSGALSALDFGYDPHGFSAFARRIAAGRYPVDVVIVASRVAAVRVRFSDSPPASWHPATFAGKDGHVVGVDAANLAIFDVASFVQLEAWEKEKLYERYIVEGESPIARIVSLREENDCAIVETGVGDGGYPCYWGCDARGEITQLLVDFMMLATALEETASVRWTGGAITHPLLTDWNVDITFEGREIVVRGSAFKQARLLKGDEVVVDTNRLGVRYEGDVRTFKLAERMSPPLTVEATLATGFRSG